MQKIVFAVIGVLLVIVIIYLVSRLNANKDKIIVVLSILVPYVYLIIQNFISSPTLPPDYIPRNRPWIEPILNISNIDDESFRASYDIKNIGKLPAEAIRIAFSSPEMNALSKSILIPRSIAPNGSILYEPNFLKFRIENLEPVSWFILAIDYHTVLDGKDSSFNSVFRIAIRKDELTEGVHKPTSILRLEGEFSDEEMERILGFRTNFKR